jgi:histidinol-phosphate aminotransferase
VPSYIQELEPYQAGKPIWEVQAELGLREVIKLASNENPLGPSPRALEAMRAALADLHRYPDQQGTALRRRLAERFGLQMDNVVLGNGSEGIMAYIVRTFCERDDEILTSEGTFVGFMVLARARRVPPVTVPLKDYRFDLEAIADRITERTKIVFLCNPNNPTGTIFTRQEFDRFLERLPPRVLVILDEAYFEYAAHHPEFPNSMDYRHDQVITLRTFSKAYGLAGARIGYGFGHDYLIRHLHKVKLPFEPGSAAQAAGLGALDDAEFLERSLALNREGLAYITRELERLGVRFLPSYANFVMLVFSSAEEVGHVYTEMLRRGVIIRPLARFGLPHCLRVTVGLPEENRRCIQALGEVLSGR